MNRTESHTGPRHARHDRGSSRSFAGIQRPESRPPHIADPEPHYRRLPPRALTVWHVENALAAAVGAAVTVLIFSGPFLDGDWIGWELLSLAAIGALALVEAVVIIPRRYRFYRYAICADCIVIVRGSLVSRQVTFPVHQILYLNSRQGPVLRRYGLFKIHIGTIAEPHSVGPFPMAVVEEFRCAVKVHDNAA